MTEDERWIGGIKTGPPCSGCNKSPSRGSIERRSPEDGVTVDEMPLGEYPPLTADMLGTSVRPAGPAWTPVLHPCSCADHLVGP